MDTKEPVCSFLPLSHNVARYIGRRGWVELSSNYKQWNRILLSSNTKVAQIIA